MYSNQFFKQYYTMNYTLLVLSIAYISRYNKQLSLESIVLLNDVMDSSLIDWIYSATYYVNCPEDIIASCWSNLPKFRM